MSKLRSNRRNTSARLSRHLPSATITNRTGPMLQNRTYHVRLIIFNNTLTKSGVYGLEDCLNFQ